MGWYGLVWVGLGWYGLVWVGMGWYGLICDVVDRRRMQEE